MGKRIALVTGASRGIGFEIAKQLAKKEIFVLLTARDLKRAEDAAIRLKTLGLDVSPVQLDVTDQENVDRVTLMVEKGFGRLDILVNNAGILIDNDQLASSVDLELVRRTLETNLLGAWRLCKAFIPLMRRNNYGRIVNLSSRMGAFEKMSKSGGYSPAYSLSKTSLNALTVMLASELHGTSVLVNAASPGWARSDMGGTNAPQSVEEGADTCVWLATLSDGTPSGYFFHDRRRISW